MKKSIKELMHEAQELNQQLAKTLRLLDLQSPVAGSKDPIAVDIRCDSALDERGYIGIITVFRQGAGGGFLFEEQTTNSFPTEDDALYGAVLHSADVMKRRNVVDYGRCPTCGYVDIEACGFTDSDGQSPRADMPYPELIRDVECVDCEAQFFEYWQPKSREIRYDGKIPTELRH